MTKATTLSDLIEAWSRSAKISRGCHGDYFEHGYATGLESAVDDLEEMTKDMVLVPIKPTEAMLKACVDEWDRVDGLHLQGEDSRFYSLLYKAMLKAIETGDKE